MAQLAIKGHETRGKEVIELLEMLGGKNKQEVGAIRKTYVYFVDEGTISFLQISQLLPEQFIVFTLEEFEKKFPYNVQDRVKTVHRSHGKVHTMKWVGNEIQYRLDFGHHISGWYGADELQPYKEETMEEKLMPRIDFTGHSKDKYIIDLGNYEIKEENGKTYAVRKQPQYPKTYKECCELLSLGEDGRLYTKGYKARLIQDFQKLLICRDAYWKIAGIKMGLLVTWKPDWKHGKDKFYCICTTEGEIVLGEWYVDNKILAFPTKEIRDTFYKNFKELIEECKELL